MRKTIVLSVVCLLVAGQALAAGKPAARGEKPDIVVMTQNQYLGADLTAIISAQTPEAYNAAVVGALLSVAGNNLSERAVALAASIADHQPHLVGLQEVFEFGCIETGTLPGACGLFAGAFNDHLAQTMSALDSLGAGYTVAAVVKNLDISPGEFPLPGLPLFLDPDDIPELFITVRDRDVILARDDVVAEPVPFPLACDNPSLDGCNFQTVASTFLFGETLIEFKRGFVGVDAVVDGQPYRFVNTHLEVQFPSPDPVSQFIQAAQASEMLGLMSALAPPDGTRQIILGDINSSPDDGPFLLPSPPSPFPVDQALTPYLQLQAGRNLFGQPISVPFTDSWNLRPGKPRGYTCCQLPDLSNAESMHDERIDVIFAWPAPVRVKANVLDNDSDDKTLGGLWPSDHSSVVARLSY